MTFQREILPPEHRDTVSNALQATLNDLLDLSMQTKQAHWNVRGPNFRSLHLQLDEIFETTRMAVDEIAERLAQIGVASQGNAQIVAKQSRLEAYPEGFLSVPDSVSHIADRLAQAIRSVREGIETTGEVDPVTEDLLIETSAQLEEHLWMVQAQEEVSSSSSESPALTAVS